MMIILILKVWFGRLCLLLVGLFVWSTSMADVKNTEMEIQKHLFIDDGIIENLIDVKRILN